MSINRVTVVEGNLDQVLAEAQPAARPLGPDERLSPNSTLTAGQARELFEDQLLSRALDVVGRELKAEGLGYYTISSAGHEQNAVLGAQLRLTDPCLLHYRSGGLMMARQRLRPGSTPLFDTLLSLCASSDDPVCEGRHKVWGSRDLWVPPQTSTIASHVPKAIGLAFSMARARRLGIDTDLPGDSIVCCSFGDASANHATALAGVNSARYAFRRKKPTPVLFVCEDNQRGISVDTPRRWIQDFFSSLPHLAYFSAKGTLEEIWETTRQAIQTCRATRGPVFLRLSCVRLWGHAGTDLETAYRSMADIEEAEAKDPILANARHLIEVGAATPGELRELVRDTRDRARAAAAEASRRPKLSTRAQVLEPLYRDHGDAEYAAATEPVDPAERERIFGGRLPEDATAPGRRTLAALINGALHDEMIRRRETIVFGEDVGKKGGVYGVTQHLHERFGVARAFDTLLDETTILGVAQGAAHIGMLPIPEICYLAYLHNAIDQLRGEASSLSFFSGGQFENPMVVRIAGYAYQRGFGGHFHNDNSIGALREIPGLLIASPSRGDDAVRLLRGAVSLAAEDGRIVCFLEPIALYHERDLYEAGDEGWLSDYPLPDGTRESILLPGEVGVYDQEHADLLIVSYANGLRLSLRAARTLREQHGIHARVLDLRWLAPLPMEAIQEHARACEKVLVVDECRATGAGVADALVAGLVEGGFEGRVASVRAADCFVPLGPAAHTVLVSEADIVAGALGVAR